MTDTPTGLDEAVRMFKGYVNGDNGFDELDFKEWLLDWHNKQIEEAMAKFSLKKGVKYDVKATDSVIIITPANKLKERDDE